MGKHVKVAVWLILQFKGNNSAFGKCIHSSFTSFQMHFTHGLRLMPPNVMGPVRVILLVLIGLAQQPTNVSAFLDMGDLAALVRIRLSGNMRQLLKAFCAVLAECPAGTFKPSLIGSESCQACPVGATSDAGSSDCRCPENKYWHWKSKTCAGRIPFLLATSTL